MQKARLTDIPRPFICGVVADQDPQSAIATIRMSEADGASAFELYLGRLGEPYRTAKHLAQIFARTPKPFLVNFRRFIDHRDTASGAMSPVSATEESRIRAMVDAIEAGAQAIDMELDSFDPHLEPFFGTTQGFEYSMMPGAPPREVSEDPDAVRRQREIVEEVHRLGGEVLISCHALTRLTLEQTLRIASLAQERGADVVKINRFVASYEDLVDTLQATVALRRRLSIPFIMMGAWEYGKLSRIMTPMLGTMLVYCNQSHRPGEYTDRGLIRNAKAVFDNIDWGINEDQRTLT